MTRVLVTGAGGFVARHAVAALAAAGAEVHAVGRRAPVLPDAVGHACDLLDQAATRTLVRDLRPTHLLHAAWVVEHGVFWASPANLDWLAASCTLFRTAVEAGCGRIVGLGTGAEYALEDPAPEEERSAIAPNTLYGTAKAALASTLAAFARQEGVSHAWGRLFLLTGPGEGPRRLVPDLTRRLLAGRPAPCGNPALVRDIIDVRDAGAALAALTLSDVAGPVNVATGRGVSLGEVATRLGTLCGRPDLVVLAEPKASDQPVQVPPVARLAREVGFTACRTLDETLRDAVAFWRAQAGAEVARP